MSNPNLVRKISDSPSGSSGEISPASVISTSNLSKNYLMNADMSLSQRGSSFAAITSGAYCLDRYRYSKVGTMVHTVSRDSDVPSFQDAGRLLSNSLRFNLTTPDTTIGATDYARIQQKIEGYIFAPIAQKDFTLSFWVKATLSGTYCVAFRNNGADYSYVSEYSINTPNTWEYKTVTVSASPSLGGWNYTNLVGLEVDWIIAAGSSLQTAPNVWTSGNFMATANQVNGTNTGATDFRIAGVMLNEGRVAAPFKLFGESFNEELQACQRYLEKSYAVNDWPVAGVTNRLGWSAQTTQAIGTGQMDMTVKFSVEKRAVPTITLYDGYGNINRIDRPLTVGNQTGGSIADTGTSTFLARTITGNSSGGFAFHWYADAEL